MGLYLRYMGTDLKRTRNGGGTDLKRPSKSDTYSEILNLHPPVFGSIVL